MHALIDRESTAESVPDVISMNTNPIPAPAPQVVSVGEESVPDVINMGTDPIPVPEMVSVGVQTLNNAADQTVRVGSWTRTIEWLVEVARHEGIVYDFSILSTFIPIATVDFQHAGAP